MKQALFALFLAFALLAATPAVAHAAERPAIFALVVTNNHSAALARPDLRYADDDGAKYYELFRMLAPEENTRLLTELDQDTARLFPGLAAKTQAPTREAVLAAARAIAAQAAEAKRAGRAVELYFVFAGHGDVDRGQGFLELADGRFTSDDLEALLKSIPATHAHVILDSCNSFFVLNARKPGGRRFATSEDAARSLSARLPNVGVFLSTSAASEVFEWSELQAGIFSHAVRSGLLGAADANGDGVVTYAELRAFVGVASSSLKNPLHRPQVFARGPAGADDEPLLDLRGMDGTALRLEPSVRGRLTVRDRDELPWIDLNKEEGFAVTLHLPASEAEGAFVEESGGGGIGASPYARFGYPSGAPASSPLSLAQLTPIAEAAPAARGPNDLFKSLFALPFGPKAFAAFEDSERMRGEAVYGLAEEDKVRMGHMLDEVAALTRSSRMITGVGALTFGAAFGTAGALVYGERPNATSNTNFPNTGANGAFLMAVGGGFVLGGGLALLIPSNGERLRDSFDDGLRTNKDPLLVVAETEDRLRRIAGGHRRSRRVMAITSGIIAGLGAASIALTAASPWYGDPSQKNSDLEGEALITGLGATLLVSSLFPSPIERMWTLWSSDPGLSERVSSTGVSAHLTVGLGGVGVGGTF